MGIVSVAKTVGNQWGGTRDAALPVHALDRATAFPWRVFKDKRWFRGRFPRDTVVALAVMVTGKKRIPPSVAPAHGFRGGRTVMAPSPVYTIYATTVYLRRVFEYDRSVPERGRADGFTCLVIDASVPGYGGSRAATLVLFAQILDG
jgi:hypothetical protein